MITIGNTNRVSTVGGKFTGTYFGKVGKDISNCGQDLACALTAADLRFSAVAESVKDIRGNVIPRVQNIVRADTGNSLGVNGERYAITQPSDAFRYLGALPGEARFMRGGMLKGGRFFLSAEFDTFNAGGNAADNMTAFGVFLSSFDGSWANRVVWVLGRHSCANICRFEIGSANVGAADGRGGRAAKHTLNHAAKIENFVVALHLAQTKLETEVSRLNNKPISRESFEKVVASVVAGDSTRSENMRAEIASFFTREDFGIHGRTVWDAFNAFSAYDTHAATRRATEVATAEENAFDALLSGRGYADRALPALIEFARN
jgi:hypothetical protein